jgi:hypothetical protein
MGSHHYSGIERTIRQWLLALASTVVLVAPFAFSATAGATRETAVHDSLTAHATLACGSVTFQYSTDTPVTYQQIHATGVSCALAKSVIVRGGKHGAKPPAGWTFVAGKFLDNGAGNCGFTWKRGADRVTGWIVNAGGGC